jgi:hypothetical protein
VKLAGKSPDEPAQLAHESGFIDEPDPQLLKGALERDLSGEKVYSLKSDRFERKLDVQRDRAYQAWAQMAEKEHQAMQDEVAAEAQSILDAEDVTIAGIYGARSARQVLQDLKQDVKAANILKKCLLGSEV